MEKFYFFNSFLDTARAIEDKELRLKYLMAVAEYWIEWKESDDPIVKALMVQTKFTLDRSKELSHQKSDSMKGNQNAVKNFEKVLKQRKTDTNRVKQKKQEEEVEEEIEVEEENKKKEKNNKKKFLDFVLLTEEEHTKLVNQFWMNTTNQLIDKLNNYLGSTGKRYKSHYFTILSWARKENTTHTNLEKERLLERHRAMINEQINSFTSQSKQNAEATNQGWYNRRDDIRLS